MKHLKALGLATLAAATLAALLGAGSASATVLCKTGLTTGCGAAGWDYGAGTTIHGVSTGEVVIEGFFTEILCTSSTIEGRTKNTGGAEQTVEVNIEALSFEGCKCEIDLERNHVVVLALGSLEIHYSSENEGAVTNSGTQITIYCTPLGTKCRFSAPSGGGHFGTLTSEEGVPVLKVDTVLPWASGDDSPLYCGNASTVELEYELTEPQPLMSAEN